MDKMQKVLAALPLRERQAMLLLIEQIIKDVRKVPGVKALQGMKGWFRVRMGNYRIIFIVDPRTKAGEIKRIGRKNESTYKNLG